MIRRREVTEPQGLFHPCRAYSYAALAFLAHTVELMSGLPGWLASRQASVAITEAQISQASIWIALGAMAVFMVGRTVTNRPVQIAVAVVTGFVLARVVTLTALSLATWSYVPGTATALALVLPAGLWLYRNLPLADPARLAAAGAGVLAFAPLTWAALWVAS
ncbi:HXXEE domain-containing protein [Maritimibacter sp. UBA3975]|uniref:HXXEE domain-containing protein n=1 Tax=Maritimibacter sp. UBA3975 TaxID=1946833 RepID=UPI000C09EDDC|nr:HXXEE domain-containing protein [Maritimibacter sp. UBA3975]MAM63078.1 hypothetical protein [Maritimibacter sp.]